MDIRITNNCNNNCLFCLEQSLRKKEPFFPLQIIQDRVRKNYSVWDSILWIYWWNPLLHPQIVDILKIAQEVWFTSISILSNTYGYNQNLWENLKAAWLTGMGIYFHSFDAKIHHIVTQWWIPFHDLLKNIIDIRKIDISVRCIVHVHKLNILELPSLVKRVHSFFWVNSFDFVNYFPFDRPYDKYHKILSYNSWEYWEKIDELTNLIKQLNLQAKFLKFSREFFWKNTDFYSYEDWVISQIGLEDQNILNSSEIPFCKLENRCQWCFLKDTCKFYERSK